MRLRSCAWEREQQRDPGSASWARRPALPPRLYKRWAGTLPASSPGGSRGQKARGSPEQTAVGEPRRWDLVPGSVAPARLAPFCYRDLSHSPPSSAGCSAGLSPGSPWSPAPPCPGRARRGFGALSALPELPVWQGDAWSSPGPWATGWESQVVLGRSTAGLGGAWEQGPQSGRWPRALARPQGPLVLGSHPAPPGGGSPSV